MVSESTKGIACALDNEISIKYIRIKIWVDTFVMKDKTFLFTYQRLGLVWKSHANHPPYWFQCKIFLKTFLVLYILKRYFIAFNVGLFWRLLVAHAGATWISKNHLTMCILLPPPPSCAIHPWSIIHDILLVKKIPPAEVEPDHFQSWRVFQQLLRAF